MNLISIRIITSKIEELINFYEQVTGVSAMRYTPDFAEVKTKTATLAIGSTNTLQFFGGDNVAQPAHNRSVIIEFMVEDVQQHFEKLAGFLKDCTVQEPTTMPWGNKSLLLRDPDGNLVNLFTPVSREAVAKFEGS
ncbi:VOC family protein [Pedobacter sp. UBA5917]|jgi:predicted enzyme related to lactoylglutathione lyase|uniref:VOC family protein n=1 Tax=Pedobacter sp. UBA5917 TaxID=1947061 RepID=UPI0025CEEEB5|nr:VOC family protein [Pedobacter sp. UBA5917]